MFHCFLFHNPIPFFSRSYVTPFFLFSCKCIVLLNCWVGSQLVLCSHTTFTSPPRMFTSWLPFSALRLNKKDHTNHTLDKSWKHSYKTLVHVSVILAQKVLHFVQFWAPLCPASEAHWPHCHVHITSLRCCIVTLEIAIVEGVTCG